MATVYEWLDYCCLLMHITNNQDNEISNGMADLQYENSSNYLLLYELDNAWMRRWSFVLSPCSTRGDFVIYWRPLLIVKA